MLFQQSCPLAGIFAILLTLSVVARSATCFDDQRGLLLKDSVSQTSNPFLRADPVVELSNAGFGIITLRGGSRASALSSGCPPSSSVQPVSWPVRSVRSITVLGSTPIFSMLALQYSGYKEGPSLHTKSKCSNLSHIISRCFVSFGEE